MGMDRMGCRSISHVQLGRLLVGRAERSNGEGCGGRCSASSRSAASASSGISRTSSVGSTRASSSAWRTFRVGQAGPARCRTRCLSWFLCWPGSHLATSGGVARSRSTSAAHHALDAKLKLCAEGGEQREASDGIAPRGNLKSTHSLGQGVLHMRRGTCPNEDLSPQLEHRRLIRRASYATSTHTRSDSARTVFRRSHPVSSMRHQDHVL